MPEIQINLKGGYVVCDVKVHQLKYENATQAVIKIKPRTKALPIELEVSIGDWLKLSRDICSALSD
jgi:hypothetical protein